MDSKDNTESERSSLDVKDEFQQDEDSCSGKELFEIFPSRYLENKKISLIEGLPTQNSYVQLVVNKDETTLATANKKGEICIVNIDNGTKLGNFTAHSKEITDLKFCPTNSNLLYSSSLDNKIKLRDLRTNNFEHTYEYTDDGGHGKEFTCLAINCSGEFICSGTSASPDETAHLIFWDLKNNKMLGGYSESHSDDITSVNFHPTKRHILMSAAMDNLINFYDISKQSESDAFSNCINLETTADTLHWDPHCNHQNNIFAINYPQIIQYWDVDDTKPTAKYGAKRLCKAIKRQRPDQCHFISLNFDHDLNPLFMISSNLGLEEQTDACIRTVSFIREKNKTLPHSVLEMGSRKVVQVYDSLYLSTKNKFVTLEGSCLRYWSQQGIKRTVAETSSPHKNLKKEKK